MEGGTSLERVPSLFTKADATLTGINACKTCVLTVLAPTPSKPPRLSFPFRLQLMPDHRHTPLNVASQNIVTMRTTTRRSIPSKPPLSTRDSRSKTYRQVRSQMASKDRMISASWSGSSLRRSSELLSFRHSSSHARSIRVMSARHARSQSRAADRRGRRRAARSPRQAVHRSGRRYGSPLRHRSSH